MEKVDLQYVIAPFIETALADAYQRGAKDWDEALGTFLPGGWESARTAYVKAALAGYAEPIATALAIAGHAAAYDVLFERARQQEQERFDQAHDDAHSTGGLARAAACYLAPAAWSLTFVAGDPPTPPDGWPWEDRWWKPGDDSPESYRRRLVKGAALAIAEIERVDRLAAKARG